MLAGYARFKYPNLIQGSIAASAPIYMIAGQSSRDFFFQDVSKVTSQSLGFKAPGMTIVGLVCLISR